MSHVKIEILERKIVLVHAVKAYRGRGRVGILVRVFTSSDISSVHTKFSSDVFNCVASVA